MVKTCVSTGLDTRSSCTPLVLAFLGASGTGSAQPPHLDYLETHLAAYHAFLAAPELAGGRDASPLACLESICGPDGVGAAPFAHAFLMAAGAILGYTAVPLPHPAPHLASPGLASQQNAPLLASCLGGHRTPAVKVAATMGITLDRVPRPAARIVPSSQTA